MKSNLPLVGKGPQRDPAKEQSWRRLLKQFVASGQSVRRFCAIRQLKESAFYFWRREIQRRGGRIPARGQRSKPRPVSFTKVLVQPPVREDGLRLRLSGGQELRLPASWSPEQVASLIHALEDAA